MGGKALTSRRIGAVKDGNIDVGEIPELDETSWREAEIVAVRSGIGTPLIVAPG